MLTQYHLDNWTDEDFKNHIPAVRGTVSDSLKFKEALKDISRETYVDAIGDVWYTDAARYAQWALTQWGLSNGKEN